MKKLILMTMMTAMAVFTFAQDTDRFIEVEGTASKTVEPDMIVAELSFYSYSFDYGNEKDEQKFESMVMKMQEKLNADDFAVDQEDLNSECSVSYEKYIELEFDNYDDYARMEEMVYDMSTDDIYVDLYLDDYRVSDQMKEDSFEELFNDAMDDAQAKAQLVADKFGLSLGAPLQVIEYDDYYDDYYYDDYYYDYYYENEGIELEKSVTIRFAID